MNFNNSGRYSVPSNEDFEPGSNEEVLKNYHGIKSKEEIEILEEEELKRAETELIEQEIFDVNHQFTAEDICNIHELWLGDLYPFAGYYRTVTMSKDGYYFAAANQIENLMQKLELNFLAQYTPCHYEKIDSLSEALGIIHIEFILIHPFREGNGRVARLLADLMAMQANKPPLNYSSIDKNENPKGFERYILAIHAGHMGNYEPIKQIFKKLLVQSV